MSNLRRKIENIKIDNKNYIMAFDMTSVDIFQELTGQSVLQSVVQLNKFEDKIVLAFIASTLRLKNDEENPIGKELYTEDFDLLALMIMLIPTLVMIINEGFPKTNGSVKKKEKISNELVDIDWLFYMYTTVLGKTEKEFWNSTLRKIFSQLECYKEAHSDKKTRNIKKSQNGSYISNGEKVLKCLD